MRDDVRWADTPNMGAIYNDTTGSASLAHNSDSNANSLGFYDNISHVKASTLFFLKYRRNPRFITLRSSVMERGTKCNQLWLPSMLKYMPIPINLLLQQSKMTFK